MDMKPASGKSHAARRIRKRPFRMLAAAATILLASALIAGCQKSAPKNAPALHLGSSFLNHKTRSSAMFFLSESEQRGEMRRLGEEAIRYADMEGELRSATSAGRKALLSKAVDKLEARRVSEGEGSAEGSDSLDSEIRKEDSLFLVKAICENDSEWLFKKMEWEITDKEIWSKDSVLPARTGDRKRVNAARWRDSLTCALLDSLHLMLPEARERRHDSLLLNQAIIAHVRKRNPIILKNIFYDSTYTDEKIQDFRVRKKYLNIYEQMKLPDGSTRKQDSLELIRRFAALERQWDADQRAEELFEKRKMERKHAKHSNTYVPGSAPPPGYSPWGHEWSVRDMPAPHWVGRE
jgi:hypothetical protein